MGKTSRWLRALLGFKKSSSDSSPASEQSRPTKGKKKWGFARSFNSNDRDGGRGSYPEASSSSVPYVEGIDASKHAIAVAAATAAVAEAALAAAQAAAEVVRLTSRTPATAYVGGSEWRWEWAAVKIQSAFRAYLARRALRALKGLVRLQALVRGHIVRKQSTDMLRRMQAMARIQARASENRAHVSEPSYSNRSSQSCNPGHATSKKCDNQLRAYSMKLEQSSILKSSLSKYPEREEPRERAPLGSNCLDQWMEECSWNGQGDASLKTAYANDARSDKILEVDTWKPHLNSKQRDRIFRTSQHFNYLSKHSTKFQKQNLSVRSGEVSSVRSLNFPAEVNQAAVWMSENSPRVHSASSRPGSSGRKGPFSPARSESSRSIFSSYLGYPNYMSNTESSLAKVRSHSAPRQRMQVEKLGSTNRFGHGFWDTDTISERGSAASDANFGARAYSGSGHLDRFGMPIQGSNSAGYSSSYHRRY